MFKKILMGIGILIVIGAIGSAIGGGDDKSTSATSAPAASSVNSSQPSKPAEKPAELSKEGISSNVKITVLGFESADTIGDNQFSTAKAQGVFKIVKISVTNNQKDAITVDANSFKLIDDQKREFSPSSEASMAMESSVNNKKQAFVLK